MNTRWAARTVQSPDSPEAAPQPLDWREAQPWCNFVLMYPTALPEGTTVQDASMRPEAPPGRAEGEQGGARPIWTNSNRSCYRFEVAGSGRRLRVKEFLYDWAPPAFDHPCLWLSRTSGFEVGDDIGWLGLDFRKLPGASLHVDRTMIELSVLEGQFTAAEIIALYRSLQPAVPEARGQILDTPLADLSYQSRHQEPPIAVPVGYWAHKRKPPTIPSSVFSADNTPAELPGAAIAPRAEHGYRLDSIFVYGDSNQPQEVDFHYQKADQPGHYLRILSSPAGASGGISYPPVLDRQPCGSKTLTSDGGREVFYAFHEKEKFGPHEAVWQQDGLNIMMVFKPTPRTNRAWFLNLMDGLLGE